MGWGGGWGGEAERGLAWLSRVCHAAVMVFPFCPFGHNYIGHQYLGHNYIYSRYGLYCLPLGLQLAFWPFSSDFRPETSAERPLTLRPSLEADLV